MQKKELFSRQINDFLLAVSKAQGKMDGRTFWPASGGQLSASYIGIDSLDIFNKMSKIDIEKSDVKKIFGTPSKIRYLLTGNYVIGLKVLVREKKITKKQSIDSIKNFFNALERLSPGDMFCLKGSNPVFSKKELSSELKGIIFNKADEEARKIIPRLGVSLDSLIWSEYYDIFIAAGMDIQGPFVLENGRILVIKDFFDLKPVEIWDSVKEFPAKRIRLFLKYNPIDLKIDYLLHETSSQPLSQNLFEWAVEMTDSKGKKTFLSSEDIPELTAKALEIVSKQTDFVNSLPRLEQIRKGAEICYYQSKELREFFNSSWKPPKEVFQAIESKGLEVWEKFDWKKKHDEHSSKADWIKRYDPREKL